MSKTIGIVVLNYNTYEKTIECIDSIINNCSYDFKIYVIDNNSPNDSFFILREKYKDTNRINCFKNSNNSGYAAGNNVGIKMALEDNMDYILISNNDVAYKANAIDYLAQFLDTHGNCGCVGPKIIDSNGRIQRDCIRNKQGYMEKIFTTTPLRLLDFFGITSNYYYTYYDYIKPKQVYSLNGCCMLFRKEIFEHIGFLDENTFFYQEEAILFSKIENTIYKVYIDPNAEIIHYHGASTEGNEGFAMLHFVKSEKYYCTQYLFLSKTKLFILLFLRWLQYLRKCFFYKSYRKNYWNFLKVIFGSYN